MSKEIWKDIEGYEGYYQISSHGRVRSLDRNITHKNGRPQFIKGKLITPNQCRNGYLATRLYKDNICKKIDIHRLVAMAFLPNPHQLPEVNHIDCNKQNNSADNLEWVTPKANIAHANKAGLLIKGEDTHNAKFTWEEIRKIRCSYQKGSTTHGIHALARKYNVSTMTIFYIIHNQSYKE